MSDLARLWALTAAERRALVTALVLLPIVAVRLRFQGLKAVSDSTGRLRPRATRCDSLPASALARLVSTAARRGPARANCLVQSLTLQWILARRGSPSQLKLGVRKSDALLDAHAWIECEGSVLLDTRDVAERFLPLEGVIASPPP